MFRSIFSSIHSKKSPFRPIKFYSSEHLLPVSPCRSKQVETGVTRLVNAKNTGLQSRGHPNDAAARSRISLDKNRLQDARFYLVSHLQYQVSFANTLTCVIMDTRNGALIISLSSVSWTPSASWNEIHGVLNLSSWSSFYTLILFFVFCVFRLKFTALIYGK